MNKHIKGDWHEETKISRQEIIGSPPFGKTKEEHNIYYYWWRHKNLNSN